MLILSVNLINYNFLYKIGSDKVSLRCYLKSDPYLKVYDVIK